MHSKASFRPVLGNAINFLLSAKGLFLLLFFQAIYLSPLVADWLGFIVDEGYTLDAAQRILKGEVPHRDFFFLWTPGTAYLHASLDWLGFGWLQSRWVAASVSALTSAILFSHFSKLDIGRSRFFFYFLLLFWNFSLWGFPYSSWYAVFFVALSFYFINKNFLLMGALLGFSFWFKQNVGILSFLFVMSGLFLKDRKSLFRFIFAFIATLLIPFFILCFFYGKDFFSHFISQIFIFPLTYQKVMFQGLPWQQMGSPLVTIGLWLLCLIFSYQKALPKNIRAMTLVLVLYTTIMIWSRSQTYFYGLFFSASLFILIISLIYFCVNFKKMKQEEAILFLLSFGAISQVYPRLDFQHFLFSFPFFLFLGARLFGFLDKVRNISSFLKVFLLLLLVVGGALQDIRIFYFRAFGNTFHSGLVAYGSMSALVREMYSVEESLNQLGLEKNEPLLVLPHATSIYYWLNRENRLPHLQFFPKYIESYGADPKEVLKAYEESGGKFLLLQQNSSLSLFYPDIWSEIEKNYVELSRLDHYFSIFRKNTSLQGDKLK